MAAADDILALADSLHAGPAVCAIGTPAVHAASATCDAAEIFGTASRLAGSSSPELSALADGAAQARYPAGSGLAERILGMIPESVLDMFRSNATLNTVLVCIALLYVFCIVRYDYIALYLLRRVLGLPRNGSDTATEQQAGQLRNFRMLSCTVGMFMIALLCAPWVVALSAPHAPASPLTAAAALFAAMAALLLARTALFAAIGFVSLRPDICRALMQLEAMHFAVFTLLAVPVLPIVSTVWNDAAALVVLAAICSVSTTLFVKETFLFFINQRVSILHTILYLCALVLFPATILLAPVLRGGGIM